MTAKPGFFSPCSFLFFGLLWFLPFFTLCSFSNFFTCLLLLVNSSGYKKISVNKAEKRPEWPQCLPGSSGVALAGCWGNDLLAGQGHLLAGLWVTLVLIALRSRASSFLANSTSSVVSSLCFSAVLSHLLGSLWESPCCEIPNRRLRAWSDMSLSFLELQ